MILLSTPLTEIKGIGPSLAQKFSKLGLENVKDVLYYFPFRYQDFSQIVHIDELEEGQIATIFGIIDTTKLYKTWKRKMWILECTIKDNTGSIKAIWFNQQFLASTLKEGLSVNLSGKVSAQGKKLILQNPEYEIISSLHYNVKHTGKLVPIYPETKGITSRGIRFLVDKILPLIQDIPEFLPTEEVEKNDLMDLYSALSVIHSPTSLDEVKIAEHRFAFQDLFLLQLVNASKRMSMQREKSFAIEYDPNFIKKIFSHLPFELTLAQKKSLVDVLEDLKKDHPTNRLLQGDVGSGKTIVSAISALVCAQKEKQTVFMAPTEVLAQQHYQTFKKIFSTQSKEEFLSCGVALLTSSSALAFFGDNLESNIGKKDILKEIKSGRIKIIIGTHSVIQKNVEFKNLALVVIDEQHRFGVNQRHLLSEKKSLIKPHLLSMSATPIPRTLALTVFGDLDVSIINELPKNRKPIITKIVSQKDRQSAYDFIRKQIKLGRQAFVICPRIENTTSDNSQQGLDQSLLTKAEGELFQRPSLLSPRMSALLEIRTVTDEYEKLSKKIFPEFKIEMLHGRLKSNKKEEIMKKFQNGKIDILVSTSVVEVGVDVPNASIMMIEGSERFGLSQLYQFRGRVGRGEYQSYCFLLSDLNSKTVSNRLKALITAKNGFELAQMDLKFRGPGQFLGEEQSGLPDIAMKAIQNPDLVQITKESAQKIINKDSTLADYPYLSAYLKLFNQKIHLE